MSSKTSQHSANYGRGLLRMRGGWTLREILGADYDKFHNNVNNSFTQTPIRNSSEETASRSESKPPLKKQ